MVISVLERRAEIGLRRALGATRGLIRVQFLAESILLSAIGGAGGVLLGGRRHGDVREHTVLADGIKVSLEEEDDASREFFAGSLLEEEEHADWLETELSLIGQVGEANYLAQQIHD